MWTLSGAAATKLFWEVNTIRSSSNKVVLGGEHYQEQQQQSCSGRWTLSGAAATKLFWEVNTIRGSSHSHSGRWTLLGAAATRSYWEVNTIRDKVNLGGEHYSASGPVATTLIWGWTLPGATKSVQEVNATGSCGNSQSGRWTAEHYRRQLQHGQPTRSAQKQATPLQQSIWTVNTLSGTAATVRYWIQQDRRGAGGGGGGGGGAVYTKLSAITTRNYSK